MRRLSRCLPTHRRIAHCDVYRLLDAAFIDVYRLIDATLINVYRLIGATLIVMSTDTYIDAALIAMSTGMFPRIMALGYLYIYFCQFLAIYEN